MGQALHLRISTTQKVLPNIQIPLKNLKVSLCVHAIVSEIEIINYNDNEQYMLEIVTDNNHEI